MMNQKVLVSRKELEKKALEISEITNTHVRVQPVKGKINIEIMDKKDSRLQNKKSFTGDIQQCYFFMEGILYFLELTKNKEG